MDINIESEIKKAVNTLVKYVDHLTNEDLVVIINFAGSTLTDRKESELNKGDDCDMS